jgi:hypothetical protein
MASIDAVTASFAASLAIAGGGDGPLDLEKLSGGTVRRSSQSFLLGKILHSKPLDASLVKSHFQRIWILEKRVRVQAKGDLFLFSFDSVRDKRKVLRGGAWSFDKAPVILEDYDGLLPLADVPLRHLRFWVKVEGISPAFEEPANFRLIGDLLGGYLDYDKLMLRQGTVRLFIQHDISKPIFLSRVVKFMEGVEVLLKFTFEHLVGRCKRCFLLSHVGEQCSSVSDEVAGEGSERVKLSGFGSADLVPCSSFVFTSQPPRPIGSSIFKNVTSFPSLVKERRQIVIRDLGLVSDPLGVKKDGTTGIESDVVDGVLGKRLRAGDFGSSPKKLKLDWAIRRSVLEAAALGFQEVASGSGGSDELLVKRKRGRPVGARNKKDKGVKKPGLEPLRLTYPKPSSQMPCPKAKGKDITSH